MQLHQNIKFLRKRKGVTQEAMAAAVGISRSKLAGYELNVNPPLDTLVQLADYLGVTVDVLLREPLSELPAYTLSSLLETDQYLKGKNLRILATTVDAQGRELIEVVSQKAKASYLAGFSDPVYIEELPRFSMPFLPDDQKHRVFQVDGDSMLPIPDGAWVVCTYVDDWTQLKEGEKYVVVTEQDGVTLKLAYRVKDREGVLLLCSTNPIYPPFEVRMEEVRELWRYRLLIQ
ncbi:MAG: XRE family transcriptional regulator [Nitritalea sp.]